MAPERHFPIAGIIGYNDVKELFDKAIKADRPVHILLVGPPGPATSSLRS